MIESAGPLDQNIREPNEALRISEERYRSLFQNMLNGFAHCRMIFEANQPRDFIYLDVNAAFEALTGLREVQGRRVTEVIPGIRESNPELFEVYGRVALTGNPEKLETYVPALKIWFSISVYCPQREHFVAVFDNITERKRLEQGIERERTLLLTLINSLPDLVYVKDCESRFVLANRAIADFMGVPDPAHLIGKTDRDFYSPDLAEKYMADERRIIEHGTDLVSIEESSRTAKGEFRWLLATKVPLRGESGTVIGLVGSNHDITQRKLSQQKQQEQAALLDIATDAILVCDMRNHIVYWNKSATRVFGWSWEEAREKDMNVLLFGPAGAEEIMKASSLVVKNGEWSGELHPRTKNGNGLTVEARWTLVRNSQEAPTGILLVINDVTERKAIETQLLRAQRLESLGTLAGGIAHDLNNVLAPILMGVEAIGLQHSDANSKKTLDIIKKATQRGASIVHQVLSFARGMEGERSEVQLKHLLHEIEQVMEETFPKSIEIRTQFPEDLPSVIADATHIHQVLMNLCVNARDAMPDGGRLTLTAGTVHVDETYARMHLEARAIDYVVLKVEDTGAGMAPALIEKIFDPFFTTKEPGKGTGLGLAMVRTIVKSHGGFINVYSEIGNGSSFKVYLPAAESIADISSDTPTEAIPMGKGELILVVDDEAAVREISSQILTSYGYRVATAADGTEAIALLAERKGEIQAVVTDMEMPNLDGAATIRVLRKLAPELRIIASSGLMAKEQSKSLAILGIQGFLAKPYTSDALLEMLRRVLESAPFPMS